MFGIALENDLYCYIYIKDSDKWMSKLLNIKSNICINIHPSVSYKTSMCWLALWTKDLLLFWSTDCTYLT